MESTPLLDVQLQDPNRRRVTAIEPVQFLYTFFITGSIPLYGQFVRNQLEKQYGSHESSPACGSVLNGSNADRIEAEASTWLIWMDIATMVAIAVVSSIPLLLLLIFMIAQFS